MQRVTVAVLLAASVFLLGAPPVSATAPGENGRIAFRRYFNDAHTSGAIFTIRFDGERVQRVTHPPSEILHTEPDWSPNHRWITYTRYWHGERIRADHPRILLKIHPNGTGRTDLSKATCHPDACLGDFLSSFSPDGRRIAFIRILGPLGPSVKGPVFVMRANGTHAHQVSHPGTRYEDYAPMWSPGGHRLVFVRFDERRDKDALFIIRATGTSTGSLRGA